MCIVDMVRVGNNSEYQLEELIGRNERKWIWNFGSITHYGLSQDDGFYCQNKRSKVKRSKQNYFLSYFKLYSNCFYYLTIFSSMGYMFVKNKLRDYILC